jgi:hypothetical protein
MNAFSGNTGEESLSAFDWDDSSAYTGSQWTQDKYHGLYDGEFIQIDLSVKIYLAKLEILPRQDIFTDAATSPKSFALLGSAGDFSWEAVISATDISWTPLSSQSWSPIITSSSSRYSSFRLVVSSVVGGAGVSGPCQIAEILLYGNEHVINA